MAKTFCVFWFDGSLAGGTTTAATIESVTFDSLDEAKEKIESLIHGEEVPKEHVFLLEGSIIPFDFGVVIREPAPRKKQPAINKDGSPRQKAGRKPKVQSEANGVEVNS